MIYDPVSSSVRIKPRPRQRRNVGGSRMLAAGRMNLARTIALLLVLTISGISTANHSSQARTSAVQEVATPAAPTGPDAEIMAAGDIACGSASLSARCQQNSTADLVANENPDAVLVLGDN